MSLKDKFWMWGYTQETPGAPVPFSGTSKSWCSLESAADYFGMPKTVFMNSMHSFDRVEENLALLEKSARILCGLPHGEENAPAGAARISGLSGKFPNTPFFDLFLKQPVRTVMSFLKSLYLPRQPAMQSAISAKT